MKVGLHGNRYNKHNKGKESMNKLNELHYMRFEDGDCIKITVMISQTV